MSKVLKTVAIVAAVVALTFAIPGFGGLIGITAATAATVAAVASAVSIAAGTAAQLLMKPPPMQGTVSQILIGSNMPVPYAMGRSYIGGNQIYDKSGTGSNNYDRTQIMVYTAAGPIDSFEAFQADFTTIGFSGSTWTTSRVATGFYGADGGYLWLNARMGDRPDTALTAFPGRAAFSEWGSAYKLSGYAAVSVTMEFDEEGKRWASGIPQWGVIAKWVKIYDPRLDTTYPGGSGSQRWNDESTWTWSENPALHALTYARGRFVNDIKVVGVGLAEEAIDVAAFVELANICEANGWTVGGAVYEAPGISKWDNLKRILAAAGSLPVWTGGVLSCVVNAPKTSLDTITGDDLADQGVEVTAMKSWRDRINTVVPRYRSEAHKWEYVQAEAVTSSTYVTEDGEEKTKEIQYDLVQDVDQAAVLAAYELVNSREFGPIQLSVKPKFMFYRPGEALTLDIPEAGLVSELALITERIVDPANGSVQLTLISETTAKHSFALGQTGVAPPSPTIVPPEDMDDFLGSALTAAQITQLIQTSSVTGLTFSVDSTGAVTISAHTRIYSDKTVSVNSGSLGASGSVGDLVLIYYDDPTRAGGAVTYSRLILAGAVGDVDAAFASATNPYRHFVGMKKIPTSGSSGGGSGAGTGGGAAYPGAGGGLVNYQ